MEGWRKIGDPVTFAQHYYDGGADELLLMDVVASLYGRNSLHELTSNICKNIFVPITVGGGISSVEDAYSMFEVGADKIAINTAAVRTPKLIEDLAKTFGAQAVVLSVEVGKIHGKYEVLTENGRNPTGMDPFDWIKTAVERGAGEILLYNVINDGTNRGLDTALIQQACDIVNAPVIAGGGFGLKEHLVEFVENTQATGLVIANALHNSSISIEDVKKANRNPNIFIR